MTVIFALAQLFLASFFGEATRPATAPTTQHAFAESWTGRWKGPATITAAGKPSQNFEMELGIFPTSDPTRFTWEIVYIFNGKREVRPYELVVVDAAAGKYLVDEKSSIKINSQLLEDTLYCHFHVQASAVTGSYRLTDGQILVELIVSEDNNPDETGGENGVPKVQTNPVVSVQRAVLRRDK